MNLTEEQLLELKSQADRATSIHFINEHGTTQVCRSSQTVTALVDEIILLRNQLKNAIWVISNYSDEIKGEPYQGQSAREYLKNIKGGK